MENALEITIISVLGGIIAALLAAGCFGFFWLASKFDRHAGQNNTAHNELGEKIAQSHKELSAKIDSAISELRGDFSRQMDQTKAEIINALVNHTHPVSPVEPPPTRSW